MKTWFVPGLILLALVGVGRPLAAAAPPGTAKALAKTPADAQIERTIRTKLAKSKLNSDHFTFSVTKGVATLEGSTTVMQHKGAMTRIAKTSGATSVHNNIRISEAARAKATASLSRGRATSGVNAGAGPVIPSQASSPPAAIPRATVLPPGSQR